MKIYTNDGSKMSPHDSQWGYLGCLTIKFLDIIVFEKEKYRDLVMRNLLHIQGCCFFFFCCKYCMLPPARSVTWLPCVQGGVGQGYLASCL